VVLDLRGNPGGLLGQAVHVSDLFLPKSVAAVRVIERPEFEGGPAMAYNYLTADGRMFPVDIPRVILVNGMSASASEIVAGAVQTHKEGLIMGIKSYGKGSVKWVQLWNVFYGEAKHSYKEHLHRDDAQYSKILVHVIHDGVCFCDIGVEYRVGVHHVDDVHHNQRRVCKPYATLTVWFFSPDQMHRTVHSL